MKTKAILFAAVLGIGTTAYLPQTVQAQARTETSDRRSLKYDNLPGDIKQAIDRHAGQDKVTDVTRINFGGERVYRVETQGAANPHVFFVNDKGEIVRDLNHIEDGRIRADYDKLPGEVKNTLGKEGNVDRMRIWQVTRDGKTFYTADIPEEESFRRIRVDARGTIQNDRPLALSDRERDRDRDINYRRAADRSRLNAEGELLTFENLPGEVKRTVGQEMGQDKVTHVLRLKRNNNTVYRVEVEGDARARTLWVDDSGKLMRELNSTEEGRVRVNYNDLPGNIKSVMIKEAHNQQPRNIWQVTRDRETWYVAEATDGHLIRIANDGKVMSHDSHPSLLSDLPENDRARAGTQTQNRDAVDNDRNRNRNGGQELRKEETLRDMDKDNDGKIDGVKVEFGDLPERVKDGIRENKRTAEKIDFIHKVERQGDRLHYIVKLDNGRYIRLSERGDLMGQTDTTPRDKR